MKYREIRCLPYGGGNTIAWEHHHMCANIARLLHMVQGGV